ncbi:MAG: methyltransferase domain-containing protein [Thermoanaerobaculales bacterium]|nr:methyltransferase domain-containing protein [Thermoanaerobaculales bacterium]
MSENSGSVAQDFEPSPERLAASRENRRKGRRFGWLLGDTIFDRVRVDFGLRFLHRVMKLDHLSYGMWDGDPMSVAGLRAAQKRYAETLAAMVPEGVERILDVGCGVGGTAAMLGRRGYEVEGVSPDPYQQEVFTARTGRPFHLSRFELYEPDRSFDLIMMSESAQYIMLDQLFRTVMAHNPGCYLLVADYFRVADVSGPIGKSGHRLEDFLDEAGRWGFEIVEKLDITEQALPTLELGRQWVENYVGPSIEIFGESVTSRSPLLGRILRLVSHFKKRSWKRQIQLMDAEKFREGKKYLFFLFKAPQSMADLARLHRENTGGASPKK